MPDQTSTRPDGGYKITCSKCGGQFSAQQQYLQHIQVGYPCGPTARR